MIYIYIYGYVQGVSKKTLFRDFWGKKLHKTGQTGICNIWILSLNIELLAEIINIQGVSKKTLFRDLWAKKLHKTG